LTSAATNDTSEAGKTDELDDFEEEEEEIDSLGALIGLRRPSSGAASGANTCDEVPSHKSPRPASPRL